MKKYLITLSLMLLVVTSCKKDFLQIDNPNTFTTTNFWKSERDASLGLTACYSTLLLEGNYRQWYMWMYELRSDLGWNNSAWGAFGLYTKFRIVDYNFELNRYVWYHHFQGIYRCNLFLAKVPEIAFSNPQLRDQYLSEVKFLRALYYYDMVNLYGTPPLILEPSTGAEMPSNSTPALIWAQVEKDLTEAIPNLPLEYKPVDSLNGPGRISKGAAQSLLGKVYMQQHKYQFASEKFKQVIESEKYQIVPEFVDNFRLENENNPESIFEIQFSNISMGDWPDYNSPNTPLGNKWSQYIAPRDVGGHSDGQPNVWYVNQFTDKTVDGKADPRAEWSVYFKMTQRMFGKLFLGFGGYSPMDTTGGKWPKIWYAKYSNGYRNKTEDFNSPINLRLIRYADILLLQAEALNELNGPGAEVYGLIDQVRQRPSVNIVPLSQQSPELTKEQMKSQIEHERVVELGGEGLRWQDLVRYGYLDTEEGRSKLIAHDKEFATFRVPFCKYLPLPQYDLDLNKNLKQNDGW